MIVFFGPAGSGKSLQGKLLAARYGWRWLSAGQQLRDSGDADIIATMKAGKLISSDKVHTIMGEAFKRSKDIDKVVLDGFPRMLDEAKWLLNSKSMHGRDVSIAIVLNVPKDELVDRLNLRGRADDTEASVNERFRIYNEETDPILKYMNEQGINIVNVDGIGTAGKVHDRIVEQVEKIL